MNVFGAAKDDSNFSALKCDYLNEGCSIVILIVSFSL